MCTSRRRRALAVLGASVLAAASCSGSSGDATPAPDPSTTAPAIAGGVSVEHLVPAPGDPIAGGVLAYALESDTDGFDPTTSR